MLRFIDGFDHYSSSQITRKWNNLIASTGTASMVTGRYGGQALELNYGSNYIYVNKYFSVSQSTWIIGLNFKINSGPTVPGPDFYFLQLMDSGNTQILISYTNTGSLLQVFRGTGTLLATTPVTLSIWYYLELKIIISSSIGSVLLKLNNTPVVNLTNTNTQNTGNNTANGIQFGGSPTNRPTSNFDIDDLYVCDTTGTYNNDFLGEVKVSTLTPNGAGNYSQFTKSGSSPAATNYQGVNEIPANDDTSYNSSNVPNQIDTFTFTDLSDVPLFISAIQTNTQSRKDNTGTRSGNPLIRISGTDYLLSSFNPITSYSIDNQIQEKNPATGLPWTLSDINALEAGYKLTG